MAVKVLSEWDITQAQSFWKQGGNQGETQGRSHCWHSAEVVAGGSDVPLTNTIFLMKKKKVSLNIFYTTKLIS